MSLINNNNIETICHQNQLWFKRSDVGRYLGIAKVRNSITPLCFVQTRTQISSRPNLRGLGRSKYSHDIFLTSDGVLYIAVTSKTEKAVELNLAYKKRS